MKQLKPVLIIISFIIAVSFVVPTLLVLPFSSDQASGKLDESKKNPPTEEKLSESVEVAVYRSNTETIEKLPLEDYVVGVVASEVPAEFEMEALKAQALAARTYIVSHLMAKDESVPKGADVTDTISHQVYKSKDELKKLWGPDYDRKLERITKAVLETQGKVLSYNGSPITASFFSTSNGYTVNSEDYFPNETPYLKSVESPWDKDSPKFEEQKIVSVAEFEQKLGVELGDKESVGTITSRTSGKRVGSIDINGKEFTGREIRESLGLASTDFTWYRKQDHIVISTKGYGHGVGMSQYGANGMAEEGKSFKEIVNHYYSGIDIVGTDKFLKQYTAKK
ncbi:stage II sporulation protein D [Bacillus pakistanensis]|uniref:Stage II sporulation protein D n=1 Tax=Rossellomorea pakistanensis TaxID=992288 RepID=A0ABS2NBQ8_9BACI|nr:stage II sporulation protein D [Bacillus pakistanensis]MBM7585276.1 stage II sporulation protein D [Bacillus pakistanensis]